MNSRGERLHEIRLAVFGLDLTDPPLAPAHSPFNAFFSGLRDLGYADGQNIEIRYFCRQMTLQTLKHGTRQRSLATQTGSIDLH